MRILYVITTPDHGGAQVNVLDLLSGWSTDVECVLVTGEEGYLTEEAATRGVQVHIMPSLIRPVRLGTDLRAYRNLRQLMTDVKPDLVHCHSSKAGLLGRLAASAEKIPVVFTVHGWAFESGISWPMRVTGLVSEHFASRSCKHQHIITVAEADRELGHAKRVHPLDRMTTVHNGVADVPFRSTPASGNPPIIIMVARFFQQKDHDSLLEALATIKLPFHVQFVGDGPRLAEITAKTERLGLNDKVSFLGDRHDVPELLSKAHIFALSSLWEGFPISILEAMRAGLPVIASDVGGVCESVTDGVNGLIVKPKDVEGLHQAIQRLLSDGSARERLGSAGRRAFEAQFGKRQMLEKTRQVYGKLLGERVVAKMLD